MTTYEHPSKEQFEAYVEVQKSGVTNMWDIDYVIQLAEIQSQVAITKEHCFYIMKHYGELREEYGI